MFHLIPKERSKRGMRETHNHERIYGHFAFLFFFTAFQVIQRTAGDVKFSFASEQKPPLNGSFATKALRPFKLWESIAFGTIHEFQMRDSPARGSTADKLNAHEAKETNGDERTEVSRRKIEWEGGHG
ncbi:hypothetical protein OUZ56_030350 [Daphnia magna]|uniref:Uncharacterized protein n=1 Tax=Daphnia magna TaxID=35525 RepID=A0ABQ9ZRX4_9CRUS|nr:hypothetical protein OUZ56_030350 [Daphnia magna]